MFEARVMSCKKSEFNDRYNPGKKVTGYELAVALPGSNGFIVVWSSREFSADDVVTLEVTSDNKHKAKVRVV